jgi:hypothetical protein
MQTNIFLARHGGFSLYENCLKRIVYMLMADFPWEKFYRYSEKFSNRTGTGTAKWTKRRTLYFLIFTIKNENFKILNPSADD